MNMRLIDEKRIRPGLIMQAQGVGFASATIRWGLTKWIRRDRGDLAPRVWGSHTAIVIDIGGRLFIGDSTARKEGKGFSPFSQPTPIAEWNEDLKAGRHVGVRFLEVIGATREQERAASAWWVANVNGRPYDFMAYPRLLWKCFMKSWFTRAYGWEWAWFCSEGVARAIDAPFDAVGAFAPIGKEQATPLTFEIRAGWYNDPPTLREVTDEMTIEVEAEE